MVAVGHRDAVVLVAHGDRRMTATNGGLLAQAKAIAARLPNISVEPAVLYGEPSLARALQAVKGAEHLLIYPLFMSDGYIVSQVLPRRIQQLAIGGEVSVMPPLGLDHRLPPLLLKVSSRVAREAGFEPRHSRLLVVGHGSPLTRGSASVVRAADSLRRRAAFAAVETAFLEERPYFRDAVQKEWPATVVAGFFSGEGTHALEELPAMLKGAGARAAYTGPIGSQPEIADLIASAIADKCASLRPRRAV